LACGLFQGWKIYQTGRRHRNYSAHSIVFDSSMVQMNLLHGIELFRRNSANELLNVSVTQQQRIRTKQSTYVLLT
jgi:hypothetical protein